MKLFNKRIAALVFVAVIGLSWAAWAGGGESHGGGQDAAAHGGGHHYVLFWEDGKETMKIAAAAVNFGVILVLLMIYARPALRQSLSRRSLQIRDALGAAEKARQEAEAELRKYRDRLAAIEKEVAEIQRVYREEAGRERDRLEQGARDQAKKMKEECEAAIQAEVKKARLALSNEAADLAVRLAMDIIRKEMTDADRHRLVQETTKVLRHM
ncbi:MAG: ATP synthase subunit b [Myxococcota bacterium]|nr:ATP synthase subunit b [Myxococcota bacterium]